MSGTQTTPITILGLPAIFHSQKMKDLFALVQRIGRTTATVLIEGESGSGKELIARAIHHYSPRTNRPWVDLSCGALPEHLMESELFGYEKGAFSGAESSKPGLFELAHQGTIFLDEIGELDPRMQVKLLRVLDGVPYYRLGGTRKVTVDVRIVAATNRNLAQMVKQGSFREDLYHRLAQLSVHVPPLRERIADVLPIAEYFLSQQNSGLELSDDARHALIAHSWPGNIRELRNVIVKAAVFCNSSVINAGDLPIRKEPAEVPSLSVRQSEPENLDDMEERMIRKALDQTNGHQQRAAHILGISRRTLSRKLKQYGVRSFEEIAQ